MTGSDQPTVIVLGLNYAPEHTGIAPYTTSLARHLAAEGFATKVIVGYPHYPGWARHPEFNEKRRDRIEDGVRLIRMRHPVPAGGGGTPRILMEAVFAAQVGRRLVRHRGDVVIAVSPALLTLIPALVAGRLRGHPVGVVVQDLYGAALAETGMGGGVLSRATAWLERRLLHWADSVVVIHDVFQRKLVEAGIESSRVQVIPNWAHVSVPAEIDRDLVRARLGWRDDEVIALHAGNMGVKQGLDGLVQVARRADQTGSPVRVVLLGDGSQRDHLCELSADIDRITIMEPLPDGQFETALAAADVLVLHEKPGVLEMSVPSKLTSYFSAGRPVVAATHPKSGAADLMNRSRAGTVVDAGDPEAMLGAIEQISADPAGSAATGARARAFAEAHLTAAASLRKYSDWVHALTQRPCPSRPTARTSRNGSRLTPRQRRS